METLRIINSNSNPEYNIVFNTQGTQNVIMIIEYLKVPDTYDNVYESQTIIFTDSSAMVHNITISIGIWTETTFFDYLTTQMTTLDGIITYTWSNSLGRVIIQADMVGVWQLTFPALISKYLGLCFKPNTLIQNLMIITTGVVNFTRTRTYIIKSSNKFEGDSCYKLSSDDDNIRDIIDSQVIGIFPNPIQNPYIGEMFISSNCGQINSGIKIGLYDEEDVLINTNCFKWTISIVYEYFIR